MTSSSTTSNRSTPSARHSCSSAVLRSSLACSCSASFFACSKFCRSSAASFSARMRTRSSSIWLVLRRRRHPADAQAAARLVDEVDRLVRQVAVGDVAVGEVGRGDERLVGDRHLVVLLVAVAQPLQDLDRVRERRLLDLDRLEAALEGGVLLEVLAVLVERGRADRLQLAAGEHRLQDRGRVDRALGRARADERVQLVDEQDRVAAGADLLQHLLQALLEVAAVAAAGDERAEVERVELLALQRVGTSFGDDLLGEALDDRGLADAGLADEHRVVLRAAGEHLHQALDLAVAADHRVELVLAGELGEVAAELVEHGRAGGCLLGPGCRRPSRRRSRGPGSRRGAGSPAGGRAAGRHRGSASTCAATPSPSRTRPSSMCSVPM